MNLNDYLKVTAYNYGENGGAPARYEMFSGLPAGQFNNLMNSGGPAGDLMKAGFGGPQPYNMAELTGIPQRIANSVRSSSVNPQLQRVGPWDLAGFLRDNAGVLGPGLDELLRISQNAGPFPYQRVRDQQALTFKQLEEDQIAPWFASQKANFYASNPGVAPSRSGMVPGTMRGTPQNAADQSTIAAMSGPVAALQNAALGAMNTDVLAEYTAGQGLRNMVLSEYLAGQINPQQLLQAYLGNRNLDFQQNMAQFGYDTQKDMLAMATNRDFAFANQAYQNAANLQRLQGQQGGARALLETELQQQPTYRPTYYQPYMYGGVGGGQQGGGGGGTGFDKTTPDLLNQDDANARDTPANRLQNEINKQNGLYYNQGNPGYYDNGTWHSATYRNNSGYPYFQAGSPPQQTGPPSQYGAPRYNYAFGGDNR